MTQYSKYNIVYRLQKWMDSVPGQTFLNYGYSWGASVVILGALFKLTHLPGANIMLYFGIRLMMVVTFQHISLMSILMVQSQKQGQQNIILLLFLQLQKWQRRFNAQCLQLMILQQQWLDNRVKPLLMHSSRPQKW